MEAVDLVVKVLASTEYVCVEIEPRQLLHVSSYSFRVRQTVKAILSQVFLPNKI